MRAVTDLAYTYPTPILYTMSGVRPTRSSASGRSGSATRGGGGGRGHAGRGVRTKRGSGRGEKGRGEIAQAAAPSTTTERPPRAPSGRRQSSRNASSGVKVTVEHAAEALMGLSSIVPVSSPPPRGGMHQSSGVVSDSAGKRASGERLKQAGGSYLALSNCRAEIVQAQPTSVALPGFSSGDWEVRGGGGRSVSNVMDTEKESVPDAMSVANPSSSTAGKKRPSDAAARSSGTARTQGKGKCRKAKGDGEGAPVPATLGAAGSRDARGHKKGEPAKSNKVTTAGGEKGITSSTAKKTQGVAGKGKGKGRAKDADAGDGDGDLVDSSSGMLELWFKVNWVDID